MNALDRGVRQVVIGGAGYDGRALRYAKPGVTWFEVDHPATQADKVERVARLGTDRHIRFIAADFTADPIAEPLLAAGLDPARPTLFLLEGVAVYLERRVVERVVAAFRQVAADGSELAMSVSTAPRRRSSAPASSSGWPRWASPPGRSSPSTEARELLAAAGWQPPQAPERHFADGLILARPAPPACSGAARPHDAARPTARPLSALLSAALVAFTIEADNEAEHRLPHRTTNEGLSAGAGAAAPWLTSLLMWANCLRQLPDEGITVAELRRRARTGTNLDGMRRWGYVRYAPDPGRGKRPGPDATVIPTAAGRRARAVWQAATEETEARWRTRFGPAAVDGLRAALAGVVARLDPALPDCLPILGHGLRSKFEPVAPADPQNARRPRERPTPKTPRTCRCGRCCPGRCSPSRSSTSRPPGPSLAVSANVLRVLARDGTRTRDIPALAGISKEAVAMAVGVLAETGLAAEGPDPDGGRFKIIRLTSAGDQGQGRLPQAGGRDRGRLARPPRPGPRRRPQGRARAAGRRRPAPAARPASGRTRTTGAPGSNRR